VVTTIEDINAREAAEESLRAGEEKYRAVVEQAGDCLILHDMDGKIIDCNAFAADLYGYSRDELLSLSLSDLDPDFFERRQEGASWERVKPSQPVTFTARHRKKDGTLIPVEVRLSLVDLKGERLVLSMCRDMTERRKLEIQLQQTQKLEAVGTLAGGVAHEFNNLLQAINGYTELLLLSHPQGTQGHNELTQIYRATERAADLVKQLLTFSRRVDSVHRPLNVNLEVKKTLRILERTIPRMIRIELHLAEDLWGVKADASQIEQLLINLGVNAADAMIEGGSLIIETQNVVLDAAYCRDHADVYPGNHVLISVSDTGHGMNRDMVKNIFDPFFTTKGVGDGTGLGLAAVYGIVRSHGGNIICYSEINKGTTFKVYLPAYQQPDKVPAPEAPIKQPVRGTETILIADDEDYIRDFVTQALMRFGYSVQPVSSGEEALAAYTQRKDGYDLVILDLSMPGMGGQRCMTELLNHDPQARVLIASGYSVNGQGKGSLEAGARGFIGKPYQLSALLNKVREILDEGG
jgi:two-component system, cell cycle sensor histidine kinase and response regulator CckA